MLTDYELLFDKYAKLLAHCSKLQQRNQELEDKLLNVVEKVEGDKLLLSNEIDHLADRLSRAANLADNLKHECLRYKSDCQLAVQLLQCEPVRRPSSKFIQLNEDLQKRISVMLAENVLLHDMNCSDCGVNRSTSKVSATESSEEEAPPEPIGSSNLFNQSANSVATETSLSGTPNLGQLKTTTTTHCSACKSSTEKIDTSTQTDSNFLSVSERQNRLVNLAVI